MEPAIVFRAGASRTYAVTTWVVALVVVAALATNGGAAEVVRYAALPLVLAVLGWAAFWRPLVQVERGGVRVVNVLSTTWLPWDAITGTRTRWGLELLTQDGKVGAWSLPPRSALGRWTTEKRESPVRARLEDAEGVESGGADPEDAARLIEEHRTGRPARSGPGPQPQRQVDVLPVGLLLAASLLAVATLLL